MPDFMNIFVKILTIPDLGIYKNSVNCASFPTLSEYCKYQILFI
jgi:hypothetical protein